MDRPAASWRPVAIVGALLLIAAACSAGPAQWTFAPTPEATPCPGASASASAGASPGTAASGSQSASGSAAASASPCPPGSPPASASPSSTAGGSPSASASGGTVGCSPSAKVIDIEETASLTMVPGTLTVSSRDTVCFRVTNTAGFAHSFYVGPTSDVEARNQSAAVKGIPDFTSGTQTLEYTFSGTGSFEYACWVATHLEAGMKGSVTQQ